jgi:integrase
LSAVVKIRLKFLTADRDRHGNVRYYVRRPGKRKVRIKGEPGSETFMAAYHAAVEGAAGESERRRFRPALPGSFSAVCLAYYASAEFKQLDPSTKAWLRRALDSVSVEHGDKPIARMEARHVRKLRDAKSGTPAIANKLLKALRGLFKWAIEEDLATRDPVLGVKSVRYVPKGFHSWTLDEVAQFEARHPIGTKPRLALALLLCTACRREDAVRLGRQHIRNGRLRYTQAKNEHRKPVEMDIPVHPDLAAIIEATPSNHLTFLVTEYGKPFSVAGFGNRFRQWCNQAELPHCSAHGLRKAAAARLAEAGATTREIMAITGHQTLEEVERYTRAAQQAVLANSAMEKLKK